MKANGITATIQSPLGRITAGLVTLLTALLMLAAVQTSSASAADVVGNPGAFTVTFATNGSGDGVRFSSGSINESRWPMNSFANPDGSGLTFNINVAADGTFTVTSTPTFLTKQLHNECLTGAFLCIGAPKGVKSTPEVNPYFAWDGTIDPAAGVITMNMPMRIRNQSVSGSSINDCYLGSNTTPIGIAPATNKANGVAYNFNTGTARVADAGFLTPGTSGATGGSGSSNCDRTDDWVSSANQNVPSTDTWFRGNLTIKNGSGTPVRPWPVRPSFTVSPDPVGVTQTATFDASASAVDDGVASCPGPDVSDPACGYRWDFDGDGTVDQVTNGPTVAHVYNTSGNYSPKLTIFDVNGKSETFTGSVWVQALPEAQIDSHPAAITGDTANEFAFSIPVNPYSATTQCSVDGGAWSACTSPATFNFTQADNTSGSHNFRVRGITPGGVVGPADQYDFTIDRVWPILVIDPNSVPADPTNVTSANFAFDVTNRPSVSYECQLDGGSWGACGSGANSTKSYTGLTETPNPHVFTVRGTDQYGNVGETSYSWEVDLTSPVVTWVDVPAQPSNVVSPTIIWDNDEPIQLAQCRLAKDGVQQAWQNCGSLTTKSYSNLDDAQYTFAVRTLDLAGNWSAVTSWSWRVETVPPALAFDSTPAAKTNSTAAQFRFSHPVTSTTKCTLDGGPVQDPCPSGVKYGYLAPGTHHFEVTATDPALNETTIDWTWDIKTSQPLATIDQNSVPAIDLGNGDIPVTDSADASFALNTVNGDAECRLDSAPWAACDSNAGQAYTGLGDGYHLFETRAVDEYGNASLVDAYGWLVLADAPTVTFTSTPDANTNRSTALVGYSVASADSNTAITCALDGVAVSECGSPVALTQLGDGSHTLEVTATDSAGQSTTESHTWNVKVTGPGVDITATPVAISNSAAAEFEFESDDAGATLECRLDSGSWDACTSPASLSGLTNGLHAFAVRATDSVGNITIASYTWQVDTVVPTVNITEAPAGNTDEVAALIKFTGSEGGLTFECQIDSGAWGACTSPLLVRQLAVGAHTVKVRASDDAGNTSAVATAAWVVEAPPAPVPPNAGRPAAPSGDNGGGEATELAAPATRPATNGNAAKVKQLRKKANRLARKAKALRKAGKVKRANKVQKRARQARQQARKLAGKA